jgi:hypothetical protein
MVGGVIFVCFTKMVFSPPIALSEIEESGCNTCLSFQKRNVFETPCGGSSHCQGHVDIWNDKMECIQPQIVIFDEVSCILVCHERDL